MPRKTITKTAHQYSVGSISAEVMTKLVAIAEDYRSVKNFIYRRYSGIKSISKLYPGYTVQNEMTKSGLRKQLGLPGAYFYPAIFEALVDIRNQWDREKKIVGRNVRRNENFSEADRHYVLFLLSIEKAFVAVLNRQPMSLTAKFQKRYEELAKLVDTNKLENYLRRQIRKIHKIPQTDGANRFSVTIDGYRYDDHGIYLATKEYRQRAFILLTDNNRYTRQLDVRLRTEEMAIEVQVPIEVRIHQHEDYIAEVGLAMGMRVMLTTDHGHVYGEDYEKYHQALIAWQRGEHTKYQKNRCANLGRKKYEAGKNRREEHLHSYINKELNRLIRTEKPRVIYIMKFPQENRRYGEKNVSWSIHAWQRGYIRKQLMLKCREHSVELVEVFGKGIGTECSRCGNTGKRENGVFSCACGFQAPEKQNVARNAKKRGMALAK